MAFFKQSFENGTNGANITVASSGGTGVNAFSSVSVGAGSTFTFDSTRAAHGGMSAKVVGASGVQTLGLWTVTGTALAVREYVYLTSYGTTDLQFFYIRGDSGRIASINSNLDGFVAVRDLDTGNQYLTTAQLPLNQWVRLELYVQVGNTSSNGVMKFGMYLGDSTTPIEAVYSTSSANLLSSGLTQVQIGKPNIDAYTTPFWIDDALVDTSATDLIGPYVANLPPTVAAGADITVVKNTTASLTSTASDPDGTISTYAWTFDSLPAGASTPTLTGGSTANASFTPTVSGIYVARITVTDNSGGTAFDTMRVLVPSTSLRPASTSSNPGGWTNVGGAASAAAALADELDGTYVASPAGPANASITFALNGVLESGLITITSRADIDTAVAGTLKVELLEGTTVRSTQTFNVTTGKQDFTLTTTSSEAAAITDRSNLFIRYTANQT